MRYLGIVAAGLALALSACSGTAPTGSKEALYHPDVGPFDIDGNYVEALADAPVRKNHFARTEPSTTQPKSRFAGRVKRREKVDSPRESQRTVASRGAVSPPAASLPPIVSSEVARASAVPPPPRSFVLSSPSSSGGSTSGPPRLTAVSTGPAPARASARAPAPAPARTPVTAPARRTTPPAVSQAVVVKPKNKAPIQHRIRSSDTLYGLSRQYGKSVSSLKRANGLKGDVIITGKILLIPQ